MGVWREADDQAGASSPRAALVGAVVGAVAPVVVILVGLATFWFILAGPRFAGADRSDVIDVFLVLGLTVGSLVALGWLGTKALRAAGSVHPRAAFVLAMAVAVGVAIAVAAYAQPLRMVAIVAAFAGAVTCAVAAAVDAWRGLLLAIWLGLLTGAVPTALLAAFGN